MQHGELSSLFQLGAALNLGFGAVVVFAEPARRKFETSLNAIEAKLLQLGDVEQRSAADVQRTETLFGLNKSYLDLLSDTKVFSLEQYVLQSVPARVVFMLGAMVSFAGLAFCSATAARSAVWQMFVVAVAANGAPLIAAIVLLIVSCWYEYKISPRVERLQERLFGKRSLISG